MVLPAFCVKRWRNSNIPATGERHASGRTGEEEMQGEAKAESKMTQTRSTRALAYLVDFGCNGGVDNS